MGKRENDYFLSRKTITAISKLLEKYCWLMLFLEIHEYCKMIHETFSQLAVRNKNTSIVDCYQEVCKNHLPEISNVTIWQIITEQQLCYYYYY